MICTIEWRRALIFMFRDMMLTVLLVSKVLVTALFMLEPLRYCPLRLHFFVDFFRSPLTHHILP